MPNKPSAAKALRQNKKRATKNMRLKTHIRALSKLLAEEVKTGKKEAVLTAQRLQQTVDKAVKNHVLSKNKGAHKKSAAARSLKK
jgi:ribosomal protein S20